MIAPMDRRPAAHPVQFHEVLVGDAYEAVRDERRAVGRAERDRRRVGVGPFVSVVFENHLTALHQVHEILHAERGHDERAIREALESYNELLPPEGCLGATMFIEWRDLSTIRTMLDKLLGVDTCTYLEFADGGRVQARFDPYTQEEFRLSAVQFLLFELTAEQVEALKTGSGPVRLSIEHANYNHSVGLSQTLLRSLASEL